MVNSMMHNVPTNTVARHLLQIAREDILPLVLVTYTNQLIQSHGKNYLEEEPAYPWLSIKTALQIALYLGQAGTWIYKTQKQTQLLVHSAIVTLEAPILLNKSRILAPSNVCLEAQCSTLRFAQGSVRDIVTFFATEFVISLIGYVPIAGGTTASVLSIYHRGRYVLTIVLPEVCNRHQVIYLKEHSELALSLGLGHFSSSFLLNKALEMSTGIPQIYYKSAIDQLLLIVQMSVAAHLHLPQPQKESKRTLPDPVLLYQDLIGFLFDVMLLGLKLKIPRMMNARETEAFKESLKQLPWDNILKFLQLIHDHPAAQILLPKLLRSTELFLADPIIAYDWEALRTCMITILETIEALNQHLAIRLSSLAPEAASTLVQAVFGTPKFINKTLLQLIIDPDVIAVIRKWRSDLQMENFEMVEHEQPPTLATVSEITESPTENFEMLEQEPLSASQASAEVAADFEMVDSEESEGSVVSAPSQTMRFRFHGSARQKDIQKQDARVHAYEKQPERNYVTH
jgi:hypothetical protein